MSVDQADKELSSVFLTALTEHGLTEAEAKAMIKTWNHTWFSDTGTRVFTIVDPNWVEGTLPLAIHPNPQSVKRVFVARYEILSPETENQLTALLLEEKSSDVSVKAFKALELGRFANGAAEIVSEREKMKNLSRYSMLWNHMRQNEIK